LTAVDANEDVMRELGHHSIIRRAPYSTVPSPCSLAPTLPVGALPVTLRVLLNRAGQNDPERPATAFPRGAWGRACENPQRGPPPEREGAGPRSQFLSLSRPLSLVSGGGGSTFGGVTAFRVSTLVSVLGITFDFVSGDFFFMSFFGLMFRGPLS